MFRNINTKGAHGYLNMSDDILSSAIDVAHRDMDVSVTIENKVQTHWEEFSLIMEEHFHAKDIEKVESKKTQGGDDDTLSTIPKVY